MPNNAEIISRAIDDFTKVQKRMLLAREEKFCLKVLLTSLGVNLTAIDKIKE